MGRAKKSVLVSKGKTGKKDKVIRLEQEEKLKIDRNGLEVPGWLQDDLVANNEFVRVVNETSKIDLLDNLDLSVLAIYAKAYSSYIDLTDIIDREGYTVETGKFGDLKISPYVTAQSRYADQIFKCSTKLGMSTTDRLKLIVPDKKGDEINKYLKYVK